MSAPADAEGELDAVCNAGRANTRWTTETVTDGLLAFYRPCGDCFPEGIETGDGVVRAVNSDAKLLHRATISDGGVEWTDLTAFQREIVRVIARLDIEGCEPIYGLAIKDELESRYAKAVNHGRLYPNLDHLVHLGLVEKGTVDDRTNSYELTSGAEAMVGEALRAFAADLDLDVVGQRGKRPVADGGSRRGP